MSTALATPPELTESPSWTMRALCVLAVWKGIASPDAWFPVRGDEASRKTARVAYAICAACPVRAQCLDWAINTRQVHGIWGGMGQHNRRQIINRQRRQENLHDS
jgi:WhiB family transcriptional regulator, redox-sensing transcriptional regulator